MARHQGPVLVDTNVILECYRTGSWRALTGGYAVETVDECVLETQTGYQRRRPEQRIDEQELRSRLSAVHVVSPLDLATATLRDGTLSFLDVGERALWAHALTREDAWVLCGPDKASLRFGVRLGFQNRLAALEALLCDVGHHPKTLLKQAYTTDWHKTAVAALIASEGGKLS